MLRSRIRTGLLAITGVLVVALLYAFAAYPPVYVLRLVRWGDADVYDYRRFPARAMATGPTTFRFTEAFDEERVRSAFPVENLDDFLASTDTQAFLVIQDDRILYEKYFGGAQRDSVVTSFSMAKSFTSALVGIAIEEGYIGNVDDPITRYLPELAQRDQRFAEITVQDLLRMASGIRYVEYPLPGGDDAKTYYYPDLRTLALEQTRIVGAPGERFLYNNYHPLLLGLILERATGMPVADYLQAKLWQPLGMEYPGSWSLDSGSTGFEKMESGINARAIDFAKFGRLYLQGGLWEGKQVVPAQWVAESTGPFTAPEGYYPDSTLFTELNGYYGYMWWGVRRENGAHDFVAVGNHGQFIYVSPAKKLIVVRNGERYGVDVWEWVALFRDVAGQF